MDFLNKFKSSEFGLALGVLGVLSLLFVPLPPILLDFFFTLSITASIVILLTVLFLDKAIDFTAFPMLMLLTTMLRLSLNVASTRLILGNGNTGTDAAGQIIETFGNFVMGGNYVVGGIVFLILVIINFMVITKGAGRIAEVSARFTLDALPGKQMSIDADLNAGTITEDEAKIRRKDIETEIGFFGSMDGTSKFVRGDAVAGLIITALNIIVGMAMGVAQHDMSAADAASTFTLLTVGDGLVAQIPALITSTAAGILIAKSSTQSAAGALLATQLTSNPLTLYITAVAVAAMGMLPGMPTFTFLALAGGVGALGYYADQRIVKEAAEEQVAQAQAEEQEAVEQHAKTEEEPISSILHIDTLKLELGYGLLTLLDESKGGRLTEQIKAMRRQMAREMGFVVPSLRIQDNMQLDPGAYNVSIKEVNAGTGILRPGKMMAMDPSGSAPPIEGEETVEPTFGLAARWIDEAQKEDATFAGYTVVDCATVITTHLTEIVKDNLPDLLTRAETQKLVDEAQEHNKKLIEDLIPNLISIGVLQKVLQGLLAERISIRDLPTILEALSDALQVTKNMTIMTEMVRSRLSRQISAQYQAAEGHLPVIMMSQGWEQEFAQSMIQEGEERQLAMEPSKVQVFIKAVKEVFEPQMMSGIQPVLLCSPSSRPFVRSLIERSLPSIAVLSQTEVHPKMAIRTIGSV